jgi:glycosyltransferase involved in cell wall biosynthesis
VKDGINGYALPLEAAGADYATIIQKVFTDKAAYQQLCIHSRKRYEESLNWENWGLAFNKIVQKILHP